MPQRKIATKVVVDESLVITFDDGDRYQINPVDLPEAIQEQALLHGLKQKLGDSWANCDGNIDEAKGEFLAVLEALKAGDWNRRATGTGGLLPQALANVTNRTLEECIAKVRELSDDERKALTKHAGIVAALAEIRATRAAEKAAQATDMSSLTDLF
ncbi:MAG: hypothetical protein ACYTEQ_22495 [Planctomycetota bacterium]|jgi:hypothetical protein